MSDKPCMYPDYPCTCQRATLPPSTQKPNVGGPKCEKVSAERASVANDKQVGGAHYKGKGVCRKCGIPTEHWDVVRMFNMPYMEARIFAYILRWRDKAGLQDLEKAKHFLEKLIEQINEEKSD